MDTGYVAQTIPYDLLYQYLAQLLGAGPTKRTNRASAAPAAATPPLLAPGETTGGGGSADSGLGATEAEGTGKMSKEMSSVLGALSLGRSLTNTALSVLGMGVPALGPLGWGLTALGIANKFADPYATNPLGGAPTPEAISAARDVAGAFAANDLADARQAAIDEANMMTALDLSGLLSYSPDYAGETGQGFGNQGFGSNTLGNAQGQRETAGDAARAGGDYGTVGDPTSTPSVSNPDQQGMFGNSGGATGGADMGSDSAGRGGVGDSSQGAGTGASDRAKGGVDIIRKPTRLRFGEKPSATPEKVISIPKSMKKPGLQGNERQVRAGLQSSLQELLARRRR